jgi:NADP-dependent 3-hydroxy acid dehydrogenase YdfG
VERALDDWRWVLDVNLWGVINGIHTFVPLLVAQGAGHVVNTASMAGLTVIPYNGVYNASKHAVVSVTETLRAELDDQNAGVGATVVCPGLVATRINQASRNRPVGDARTAASATHRPRPSGGAGRAQVLAPSHVADQSRLAPRELHRGALNSAPPPRDGSDPVISRMGGK